LRERARAQVVRSIIVPAPLAGEGQGEGGEAIKKGDRSPLLCSYSAVS